MLHNNSRVSVRGIRLAATVNRRGEAFVRLNRRRATLLACICANFMAMCLSASLHAQSTGFNGTVALSSQLVDRGQAITPSTPILQGAASWTSASGWSMGLSGSTEVRSPGQMVETLAQVSRYWSLSNDWQMQTGLLYYNYPGNSRSRVYNRAELGVSWIYRDVLTFGLSAAHVFRTGNQRPRAAADADFHWPLAWNLSFSAGAGVAEVLVPPRPPYSYDHPSHYKYGHVGLIWARGPWRMELQHIETDLETAGRRGNLDVSPWVATASWSF
jgi:uncharacterized protein (TIGR02001 family)